MSLEMRMAAWIVKRIGAWSLHPRERAMRMFEEVTELAQAHGIDPEALKRQIDHVYGREVGVPAQEAGGVAVCLLGWCAASGVTFQEIAEAELSRIEGKTPDQIRGSITRKMDADLMHGAPRPE